MKIVLRIMTISAFFGCCLLFYFLIAVPIGTAEMLRHDVEILRRQVSRFEASHRNELQAERLENRRISIRIDDVMGRLIGLELAVGIPVDNPTPIAAEIAEYSLEMQGALDGILIVPEDRCTPYDMREYEYPPSLKDTIIASMNGLIYGPYTGRLFSHHTEIDIEHIVDLIEAHDSGLCAASANTKVAFASDLENLTLAGPLINQFEKREQDLAAWLPLYNVCWYVNQVVEVKRKYELTMDLAEASVALQILEACVSVEMEFPE